MVGTLLEQPRPCQQVLVEGVQLSVTVSIRQLQLKL